MEDKKPKQNYEDEVKVEKEDEKEEEEPKEKSSSGFAGKLFLFGVVCAAAAGTYMYVKKNDIDVGQVFKNLTEGLKKKMQQWE